MRGRSHFERWCHKTVIERSSPGRQARVSRHTVNLMGGLEAIESALALVGLLGDETEVPFSLHGRSHDGLGTDSIAANNGSA
jgi:hypothetical protein